MDDEELRQAWEKPVAKLAKNLAGRYGSDPMDVEGDLWTWVFKNRNSTGRYGPVRALTRALAGYGNKVCGKAARGASRTPTVYSDGELLLLLRIALTPSLRETANAKFEPTFCDIQVAFDELEDRERDVLRLRACEDLHIRDMAMRLGLSRSVTQDRYARAIARLQHRFEEIRYGTN